MGKLTSARRRIMLRMSARIILTSFSWVALVGWFRYRYVCFGERGLVGGSFVRGKMAEWEEVRGREWKKEKGVTRPAYLFTLRNARWASDTQTGHPSSHSSKGTQKKKAVQALARNTLNWAAGP